MLILQPSSAELTCDGAARRAAPHQAPPQPAAFLAAAGVKSEARRSESGLHVDDIGAAGISAGSGANFGANFGAGFGAGFGANFDSAEGSAGGRPPRRGALWCLIGPSGADTAGLKWRHAYVETPLHSPLRPS